MKKNSGTSVVEWHCRAVGVNDVDHAVWPVRRTYDEPELEQFVAVDSGPPLPVGRVVGLSIPSVDYGR
jgi:hypothetical protein